MSDNLGIAYVGPVTLTPETLPEVLDRVSNPTGMVAIDTETISVKDKTCLGIGIALSSKEAIYFQAEPEMSPHIEHLAGVLCSGKVLVVYHNALFDLEVLTIVSEVWEWPPIDTSNIADTSIMSRVQGLPSSLHDLTSDLLGRYITEYGEMLYDGGDRKKHPLDLHWSKIAHKCLQDCKATYDLYGELW